MEMDKLVSNVGVEILDLAPVVIQQIKSSPQAQLRTSGYKKHVYVSKDLIFKGPYTKNHCSLTNNLKRTYALGIFEDVLELKENKRATLKWEYIGYDGNDDNYYLASRNVGNLGNMVTETKTSKIEEKVEVVQECTMVCTVLEIEETDKLTNDIKVASLQHLYLRFLLDIGDSGTHNILVRQDSETNERLIAGIDLEETRGIKPKTRPLDYLFKNKASVKQVSFYDSNMANIETLKFNQLNDKIRSDLHAVEIDLNRLKETIQDWETITIG